MYYRSVLPSVSASLRHSSMCSVCAARVLPCTVKRTFSLSPPQICVLTSNFLYNCFSLPVQSLYHTSSIPYNCSIARHAWQGLDMLIFPFLRNLRLIIVQPASSFGRMFDRMIAESSECSEAFLCPNFLAIGWVFLVWLCPMQTILFPLTIAEKWLLLQHSCDSTPHL